MPYLISNRFWHCAAQSVSAFSFICNPGLRIGAGQQSVPSVSKRKAVGTNAVAVCVAVSYSFYN